MKKILYTVTMACVLVVGMASLSTRTASASTMFTFEQFVMIVTLFNLDSNQIISLLPLIDLNQDTDDTGFDEDDSVQADTYPNQITEDIETSASVVSQDGIDDDIANFEISFNLNAFGSNAYISEYANNALEYSIINSNTGADVYHSDGSIQEGSILVSLSSTGRLDDDEYEINEDSHERLTINASYNPYGGITPAGPGSYRFQLEGVNYRTENTTTTYQTGSQSRFRTSAVNIVN